MPINITKSPIHVHNLFHFRSKIDGSGLFATKQIDKNQALIMYDGEIISNRQADSREKEYKKR